MLSADVVPQVLWTSIASSSYQILLTIAFALVLKVLGIWNFTQPALMGVAFYVMYTCNIRWGMPVWVGVSLAIAAACMVAAAIERFAFRTLRTRESESISFFIFTLIFASFVTFLLSLVFTTQPLFMLPSMMSPVRIIAGVVVSDWDLRSLAIALILSGGLWLFLRLTRYGHYVIAVADNPDLAEVYGIDRGRIYLLTMLIAAVLITAATHIFGTKLTLYPSLPGLLVIHAIAATILGGGRIFAAGVAAVVISVLQQVSVLAVEARWQPLVVFGILFLAIICFPKGVRWPQRRLTREPAAMLPDTGGQGTQTWK
jgi:branched-subunit amino acid ABC-type transport system permease component